MRLAALGVLGRFDDGRIATAVLAAYPAQGEAWKVRARELLLSRDLLGRRIPRRRRPGQAAGEGPLPRPARAIAHAQGSVPRLPRPQALGAHPGPTSEERLAEVRRLNNDLRAAPGDAGQGRLLFREKCAVCHRLGGEGAAIGPDLTFANRQDRDFLLTSLVDPAGAVRKEYQLFNRRDRRTAGS